VTLAPSACRTGRGVAMHSLNSGAESRSRSERVPIFYESLPLARAARALFSGLWRELPFARERLIHKESLQPHRIKVVSILGGMPSKLIRIVDEIAQERFSSSGQSATMLSVCWLSGRCTRGMLNHFGEVSCFAHFLLY